MCQQQCLCKLNAPLGRPDPSTSPDCNGRADEPPGFTVHRMLGRRPGGMPVRVIARQPRPVLPRSTDHDSLASAGGNKAGGDAAIHHSVRRSGTRTSLTMKMGCALWHPVGAGSAGSRHAACCGAPNNRHTSPGAPAAVAPVRPAPKRNPHSTSLRES